MLPCGTGSSRIDDQLVEIVADIASYIAISGQIYGMAQLAGRSGL